MKKDLFNAGKLFSRSEMKNIKGGIVVGDDCLSEFTTNCSTDPRQGELQCCTPSKCEVNATRSGTICVDRPLTED